MLRFLGWDMSLDVDEVFEQGDWPRLFAGHDAAGQQWLVAEISRTPVDATWLCARHSARGLACLRAGRAQVRDVLRHSIDGTVVLVTLAQASVVADHLLLCAELDDDLLPGTDWTVGDPHQIPAATAPSDPTDRRASPRSVISAPPHYRRSAALPTR